jgi:poly(ADP-ribose) glycohydrolase
MTSYEDRSSYALPCASDRYCEDRFSILDCDDEKVPTWSLIEALLSTPILDVGALIEQLETIAICISKVELPDYGFLKQHLETQPMFFRDVWQVIVQIALDMPRLFPQGSLPMLTSAHPQINLSRRQTACLVIHQFLCTFEAPYWQDGFQSFHIWYASEQPHDGAVTAYLKALFTYFERIANGSLLLDDDRATWSIKYSLHLKQQPPLGRLLQPLDVVRLPTPSTSPDVLGLPDGACVISANRFAGFGRTGTQEETHVGASPEACPIVLMLPPLADDQVLVIEGAEAMTTITGYGRDAHCSGVLTLDSDPEKQKAKWHTRTMLFMDALELDLASSRGLPDLLPGNFLRERSKAYTAFSSRARPPYSQVYTGFWGCRTFGGNPDVKTIAQWCAASMADVPMRFVCAGLDQLRFADELEVFVHKIRQTGWDADRLEKALVGLGPEITGFTRAFDAILADST